MSLLNTYKTQIHALYPSQVDRDEWRLKRYGLLNAAREMTDSPDAIASQDVKTKYLDSEGRELKVPAINYGSDVTVTSVRECVGLPAPNDLTSAMVDVTSVTLATTIYMSKSQHHKNEVSYLEDLNKKLRKADDGLCKAIEAAISTKLNAEKSILTPTPILNSYDLTGGQITVAPAQQEYFFNNLETIMEEDDFYSGAYMILGSTSLKPYVRHWANQGQSNDENLSYQFGAYNFRYSNALTVPTGKRAVGYIMPLGSLNILSRVGIDSRLGNRATDGTEWGTTTLDQLGLEVGTSYKSDCGDLRSITGLEHLSSTMVENWELSLDYALMTPYNADPVNKTSAIKKFVFN